MDGASRRRPGHDQVREHGRLPVNDVISAGTWCPARWGSPNAQGVLHRDVKPGNILRLPTSSVLTDFGIAGWVEAGHSASTERCSYRHAAPQVLDGEPPAAAADIYSLGSTLYPLLDGRPPFASDDPDADTALAYLRRVRTGNPRAFTRADVPAELAEIISRCLTRERAGRYPDATMPQLLLGAPRQVPAAPVGRRWSAGRRGTGGRGVGRARLVVVSPVPVPVIRGPRSAHPTPAP